MFTSIHSEEDPPWTRTSPRVGRSEGYSLGLPENTKGRLLMCYDEKDPTLL